MNSTNWDTVKYIKKVHFGEITGNNRTQTKSLHFCGSWWHKLDLHKAFGRSTVWAGILKTKVQSHLRLNKSQVNVLLWTGRARLQRHVKLLPGTSHHRELHSSDDSLSPEQRRGGPRLVPRGRARARNRVSSALAATRPAPTPWDAPEPPGESLQKLR